MRAPRAVGAKIFVGGRNQALLRIALPGHSPVRFRRLDAPVLFDDPVSPLLVPTAAAITLKDVVARFPDRVVRHDRRIVRQSGGRDEVLQFAFREIARGDASPQNRFTYTSCLRHRHTKSSRLR